VPLKRGALESCTGAVGGTPVPGSTATIASTATQVTAVVNLKGKAFTTYNVQLVGTGCALLGLQFVTTNGTGTATAMFSVARGSSTGAFVTALGLVNIDFQVSDQVKF
jgi:hypothetical protein